MGFVFMTHFPLPHIRAVFKKETFSRNCARVVGKLFAASFLEQPLFTADDSTPHHPGVSSDVTATFSDVFNIVTRVEKNVKQTELPPNLT